MGIRRLTIGSGISSRRRRVGRGQDTITVTAKAASGTPTSASVFAYIDNTPPTVLVTTPTTYGRAFVEGRPGTVTILADGVEAGSAKPAPRNAAALAAYRKAAAGRRVAKVEISLDNGRTFRPASGWESWCFRLETETYSEGELFILVRATFGDGSTTVARTLYELDKTPPAIRILAPAEEGRFADRIRVSGTVSDGGSGLASVAVALRTGDRSTRSRARGEVSPLRPPYLSRMKSLAIPR